jgi:hypothetical protein
MGIRVPADHAEVIYRMTCAGDPEEMLVTLGVAENFGETFTQTAAEQFATIFQTTILTSMSNQYTFRGVHVRVGPDGLGQVLVVERAVLGSSVASPVPPNTAVLIAKQTGLGGRRNRGRAYIPGIDEALVDPAGNLTPGALTAFQTDATAWLAETAAMAEVSEVVIFHSTPDKQEVPGGPLVPQPAIAPTAVTSMVVRPKVATQRRRLRP